jgi:DNA gyrase subunit A
MHWLKVYEIPESGRVGKGKAMVNLIEFEQDEIVQAMITVDEVDVPDRYIVMATANGVVKKTALEKFKHLRRKGIISIRLDEGDELIDAQLTDGNQQILLSSRAGMACRFLETDVREMGRATQGVRGMELRDAKKEKLITNIVAMTIVDPQADLLVVTEKGMGKRTNIGTGNAEQDKDIIGGYRLTRRGGKGIISIKLREDDTVIAALQVTEGDELLMTSVNGQMVRISVDDIRSIGRNSQGVRIMRLREGDRISSVSLIAEMDEPEEDNPEAEASTEEEQAITPATPPVETETEAEESGDGSPLP